VRYGNNMIGRIKGELIEKTAPVLLVDVIGVGYEILCPMTTIYDIGDIGSQVLLHTQMIVREDAQLLYGFKTKFDRKYFQALIKINGVGPKMALAILSGMDAETLTYTVLNQDISMLTSIPGIGAKTAERLMVELKDKVESLAQEMPEGNSAGGTKPLSLNRSISLEESEAISALVSLGYKPKEAQKVIGSVKNEAKDTEDMIRLALKSMIK
jgi:Holliday junction DNA helicase RuvA